MEENSTQENNDERITRLFTENILHTEFSDLDPETITNTKKRIFDMIGCAIGGAGLPDNETVVKALGDGSGGSGATVLGYGTQLSIPDAALANCVLGRSFDWGPLTLRIDGEVIPSHITETTVLTALTIGEHLEITGEELITAIVVGDDLAGRVWAAVDRGYPGEDPEPSPGFEQWGTVTTFGSMAIAGRLLGLTTDQLQSAFGIATTMFSGAGNGLWDGATTFKLSQGTAARSGILAAQLANGGWTGIDEPLFGNHGGYYFVFRDCGQPELLTRNLGETFHTEGSFKPYPGGGPTDAPIEAAVTLATEHDLNPSNIERVIVRPWFLAAHYSQPFEVGDYPTCDALFSFKYAAANALVNRQAHNQHYTTDGINNPDVQALIERTALEELDQDSGAEVEVQLEDGTSLKEYVPVRPGNPSNPLGWDRLREKFVTQAKFAGSVDEQNVRELITDIKSIEEVENVKKIVKLATKN